MQRSQRRRETRGGFTLLEVLIVLAILGVIAAMVVPNLLGKLRESNIRTTKLSLKNVKAALDNYAVDHSGTFPEGGPEVIDTLLTPSTGPDGRQFEPYLPTKPLDAWQHAFFYEFPTSKTTITEPAIWSSGPDGKNDNGGGDDIASWTTTAAATGR
jgi:general secretion pathway protein G